MSETRACPRCGDPAPDHTPLPHDCPPCECGHGHGQHATWGSCHGGGCECGGYERQEARPLRYKVSTFDQWEGRWVHRWRD